MFEDDIEVSKDYFDYILMSLSRHVYRDGVRAKDYHSSHLVGISLTTPRYDETSIPIRPWTPDLQVGEEPFFLFQLACSWGALYFPWAWRDYIEYYRWRKQLTLPKKIDVIPHSYVNIWERSWKRYLQELMFLTGKAMLYPNFRNQSSFSTHHRELGEHTQGRPEAPLVDALGTNNRPVFTVPLLNASVHQIIEQMKGLAALPVVDFYHNRTSDIYALAELGVGRADMLREFGFDLSAYNPNPACILDWACPIERSKWKRPKKYVSFVPQGSLLQQLEQLRNAIAIAYSLKRTLLAPDFAIGNTTVKAEAVLSAEHLYAEGSIKIERLSGSTLKPERLVAFQPFDSQGRRPQVPAVSHSSLRHIHLPVSHGTELDIYRWFSGCSDELLLFTRLDNAFSQYTNLTVNRLFDEYIGDTIRLHPEWTDRVSSLHEGVGDIACVEYYRPEEHHCRRPKYDYKYWRSVHYRNCNATVAKTLGYGASWVSHLQMDSVSSMYLLNGPEDMIVYRSQKGDLFTVLGEKSWNLPKGSGFLAELLEEELCARSAFFLGNAYSPRAKRIVSKRANMTTALLGMGVISPYRNETLPGLD